MQHFNGECVPERVVHAKGTGARGIPVTVRDPCGFALKFYAVEGNLDMVGDNTPIFCQRDPSKFSDFIHSQKRRPDTGMCSYEMQWDLWSLSSENAHHVTILMRDRRTPRTLRHMHGFSSHTYSWTNAGGEHYWIKYHFVTEQGVENFSDEEAAQMTAEDGDFHRRDLRVAIDNGDASVWRLHVQLMPFADAVDYRFNPFDLTKVWPHGDEPLIEAGRMVLDRNPEYFFTEVEQSAPAWPRASA